jgi:RHS repeat-associated protein
MRYDGKTGLVYMNARWYDPNAGRFMSEDTYPGELNDPQSLNRYAYVMNNPVNMWDPTGHVAEYVDGGSTTLPDGFSGIPSWVRAELDYDYEEKISDNVSYTHYWDHRYTDPYESDTRLVDTIDETRFYRQIYEQDFSTTWYYDYLKIQVIGEFPKNSWESTETFKESYTKRWSSILSAEEVANQNQEVIAKLGAPPNAKIIGYKASLSNAFSSFIEREKERHLRQIKPPVPVEPKSRGGASGSKSFLDSLTDPFSKSWNSLSGIGNGFVSAQNERWDTLVNDPYNVGNFADWFTYGIPKGMYQGYVDRNNKKMDSVYDFTNYLTSGAVETVDGALFPDDPLSEEHWQNSIETSLAVFGVRLSSKGAIKQSDKAVDANKGKVEALPNSYQGVKEASEYLKSQGISRYKRKEILESFEVGTIKIETAGDNTFGLRFHDNGVNAYPQGSYLFETFGTLTNRNNLALPPDWNGMTGIKQWQVPSGTPMITGKAAPQYQFGPQYVGGANQWWIMDRTKLIEP